MSPVPITPTRELSPLLVRFLESDLVRAVKLGVFACISASALLLLLGQPFALIVNVCLGFVALTFFLLLLPDLLHVVAKNVRASGAVAEAWTELAFHRDFNHSGAIGDVFRLEPEVKEIMRLVPTNQKQKVVLSPTGVEIPTEDFVEFVRGLALNGLTRKKWVSEDAKTPFAYKFASGRVMERPMYDAMVEILEKRVKCVTGRTQGKSGTLTAKPEKILNILGLE